MLLIRREIMTTVRTIEKLQTKILEDNIPAKTPEQAERDIKNAVILKRVLVKNGLPFYTRLKTQFIPEQRAKYNFNLQLYLILIGTIFCAILYYFWDTSVDMKWFLLCSSFIYLSTSVTGFAFKYLSLQKDFDRLIENLSKDEKDREFFIENIQKNLFTECLFSREDFNLLFKDPYTKEAAIIRVGVMNEVQRFLEAYIQSINN